MSNYPPPPPNQGPPSGPPQGPPGGPPVGPGGPDYLGAPPPAGGGGLSRKVIALIVAGVLVLAVGGAAAAVLLTGGDDDGAAGDAPESASTEEFCGALEAFDEEIDDKASAEEQAEQAHDVADKLSDVGTPEDIPTDARDGFEIYIDAIGDVDADDIGKLEDAESEDDLAEVLGLAEGESAKIEAFFAYTFEACFSTPETEDLPSE